MGCGSIECEKYNTCAVAFKGGEVVNWASYGVGSIDNTGAITHSYCGPNGKYAMYEPLIDIASKPIFKEIGVPCLVCGESIPIVDIRDNIKICDECKAAIMFAKRMMRKGRGQDKW